MGDWGPLRAYSTDLQEYTSSKIEIVIEGLVWDARPMELDDDRIKELLDNWSYFSTSRATSRSSLLRTTRAEEDLVWRRNYPCQVPNW